MRSLVYKLKCLKCVVKWWEKSQLDKNCKDLLSIDSKIKALFDACPLGISLAYQSIDLAYLKFKKAKILAHEVLTWKLKSKINWINQGDPNTKFFHNTDSSRRNSNAIWALNNEEGVLVKDESQQKTLSESFFSSLLSDLGTSRISDKLKVIKIYPSFLTDEEKSFFFSGVTLEEIKAALKVFKKDKWLAY